MPETTDSGNSATRRKEDFAVWIKRMLRVALHGGPNVESALALADKYGAWTDRDLRARAAIQDTRHGMFSRSELKRVAELLNQEAISDADAVEGIALARWLVYARLATVIALVYGHDPEQDWVQVAILGSIDSTPAEEVMEEERWQRGRKIWDVAFELLGAVVIAALLARFGKRLHAGVAAKSARSLLPGIGVILRKVGRIGPVPLIVASRNARKCRKVGKVAQRVFRFRGLPSPTEEALAP